MWNKIIEDWYIYINNRQDYYLNSYYKPLILIKNVDIDGFTHTWYISQDLTDNVKI